MDNELMLFDRINLIRDVVEKYGEENFYLSFSGGKDSTILHYLIDEAMPDNKISRVYINTGIEYIDVVNYVKSLAENDERIIVLNSGVNITQMLKKVGYPFKSKEHSEKLGMFQKNGKTYAINRYLTGQQSDGTENKFICPNCLQYQFTSEFKLKVSKKCCDKLKKEVAHDFEKHSCRKIAIIGLRTSEGGQRGNHAECVLFNKKTGKLTKFKPINPCSDEWCDWYIKKQNIKLCKLYYPPYNFKRTGCKGCPFSIDIADQLEVMARLLPAERKQCEYIWGPVYEEYRRINYRSMRHEAIKLF